MFRDSDYIQKAVRIAGWLLVAAAFLYIGIKAYRTPADAFSQILHPRLAIILLLLGAAYSLLNIILASAWSIVAHAVSGKKAGLRGLLAVHLKTGIIKYLPGNVFHFAGRHLFSEETGLSQSATLVSNILEVCTMLSALGFSLAAVYDGNVVQAPFAHLSGVSSKYVAMIASSMIFLFGIIIFSIIKRDKLFIRNLLLPAFSSLALYMAFFAATSFLFLTLGSSITGKPGAMQEFRTVAGFFCVAWASGFVIPGAPGGLGVREGVLISLLSPIWGDGSAIAAAVLFRLITVAGDMLSFLWGMLIAPKSSGNPQKIDNN